MMVNLNKELEIPGSDSFFQEVLNSVGIGIISLNSNQSIKLVNLETLNIFGYKQEEIENNNILFFDNGAHKSPQYSRCVEVEINEETPSAVVVWEYVLPNYMFTSSNAECDRLENGHTLISTGSSGNLLEINENDEIVWHVNVKLNSALVKIMRNERIPNLYPSAFSILIHALTGDIADPRVVVDSTFVVEMSLTNHGWVNDTFSLYILII